MKTRYCESCRKPESMPEVNDDANVQPKFRLDEIVRITDHGAATFKITKMDGMSMTLERC